MDIKNIKCVMVINENLPAGIISNTAAIMGITLGKHIPEIVGNDVFDKTGNRHLGIIKLPLPILKGNPDLIKELRKKLYQTEYSDLTVVDFTDIAQNCNIYDEFIVRISRISENALQYYGIAIYGCKKKVNKLTGSLPLLR